MSSRRFWMRHAASVPKGFLRYYVLRLLKEKPMSGSEIMEEIEKQTEGCWKPSPGSVYPLLTWLRDKGYTREVVDQEVGIKRYTLTEKGKAFFGEHLKRMREFPEKFRFFAPPIWFQFYPEGAQELRETTRRLALAIWNFRDRLQQKHSETGANEAKKVFEEAAKRIEEITNKLKEES